MRIDTDNKYIYFELLSDTGKTQKWNCMNKSGVYSLGQIQWYASWRQYTFRPGDGTEYNNSCLNDISKFLTKLNKEKRILES